MSPANHCFTVILQKKTLIQAKEACPTGLPNHPYWTSLLAEPRLMSEVNFLWQMITGLILLNFQIFFPVRQN